jgi:hypothetical protein
MAKSGWRAGRRTTGHLTSVVPLRPTDDYAPTVSAAPSSSSQADLGAAGEFCAVILIQRANRERTLHKIQPPNPPSG